MSLLLFFKKYRFFRAIKERQVRLGSKDSLGIRDREASLAIRVRKDPRDCVDHVVRMERMVLMVRMAQKVIGVTKVPGEKRVIPVKRVAKDCKAYED